MSNTLHQIYQSKSIVLARTMVIKFHQAALKMNEVVKEHGYAVDEMNPSTWKYYMNMFGEYHQFDHDHLLALSDGESKYLQVKIAGDTQPITVDFNKDLLFGDQADLSVANEYRFNTQYYNDIVTRYPDFQEIINGVLNPISYEISTTAEEGEILYCGGYLKTRLSNDTRQFIRQDYGPISDNFLIEPNEENLLPILQQWIYLFLERWTNSGYALIENLAYPAMLGILYTNIPNWLTNIRLANIKHPRGFTHSFHIREYLESNGKLGWVTQFVSKQTALWVYRNLRWLESNRGKTDTFNAIVNNVLTPEGIPLSGFRLKHDLSVLNDHGRLTPAPYMHREIINFKAAGSGADQWTIEEVVLAEKTLATDNYYNQAGQIESITQASQYSQFSDVNTKVLESTVVDQLSNYPLTLEDVSMNLWVYLATRKMYRGTVITTNPVNNERIQLTPLNAYILAIYCLNKGWADIDLEMIPTAYARYIPRSTIYKPSTAFPDLPTLNQLKMGIPPDSVSDQTLKALLGDFVPNLNIPSPTAFTKELQRTYDEYIRQYLIYAGIEDMFGRAAGEWVSHQLVWTDVPCQLTLEETRYDDWLTVLGIDISTFTRGDFIALGLAIVESATGVDLARGEGLRNKQGAVLAILKHFCSYSIQVIQSNVTVDSYQTGGKTLRATNIKSKAKTLIPTQLILLDADLTGEIVDRYLVDLCYENFRYLASERIDIDLDVRANDTRVLVGSQSVSMRIPLGRITAELTST